MSNSVTFGGVEIRYADTRRDEGGVFNRIHIAFDPSKPVEAAMDWDGLPDSIPSGKLNGRIAGTHVIFTPTDKQLRQYEMQFGINEVRDFNFTSKHDKEGRIISRSITATIVTGQKVAAEIENWLLTVGEASAVAKVGYTVQQHLPGSELVDDKQTVITFQRQQQAGEDAPVTVNDLNAAGSGRAKQKQRRGGPALVTVEVDDAEARAKVEQQISESLQ